MIPEAGNAKSSVIPNATAADTPISDHRNGIISKGGEILLLVQSNIPKVNMAVGHGRPKVGMDGYVSPCAYPRIG